MIFPVTNLKAHVPVVDRAIAIDMLYRAKDYLSNHWPYGYVCIALKYDVAGNNPYEQQVAELIIDAIREAVGETPVGNAKSVIGWLACQEVSVVETELEYRVEWIDRMIAELN